MIVFGSHEKNTLDQLADVASRAERVALMADGHLGYIMPVEGVAAYRDRVSVAGVGFDIACGNCAMRTDLVAADLPRPRLETLADRIRETISFGIGRSNRADDAPVDHPLFDDEAWQAVPASPRDARSCAGWRASSSARSDRATTTSTSSPTRMASSGWASTSARAGDEMLREAVAASGIVLRGAGPDESPFVYRRLESVLAAQPGIETLHRLRPLVVVMAGPDELDPYKD